MDTVLDVLLNIDTMIVKQEDCNNNKFTDIINKKKKGQFNIYDSNNNLILIGKEYYKSNCSDLLSYQKYRPYKISIRTLDNNEVLKIKREKQCGRQGCYYCIICCCALEICHQDILIFSGDSTQTPGRYLGRVKEKFNWFYTPSFTVYDDDNNEQFQIIGYKIKNNNILLNNNSWLNSSSSTFTSSTSYYKMKIYQDQSLQSSSSSLFNLITSKTTTSTNIEEDNDDEIGEISKLYSGINQNLFNDKDNIYINMPPKSTVYQKSVLIGALFLINSLYYGLKSDSITTTNNNNNIKLNNVNSNNNNNNNNNNNFNPNNKVLYL